MITLTESDCFAISNALRIAAKQYLQDSNSFKTESAKAEFAEEGRLRLIQCFDDQAIDAEKFAAMFEDSTGCKVSTDWRE